MSIATFSIKDVLKNGWELTKANLGFLIVYQIILLALVAIHYEGMDYWIVGLIISLASTIAHMGFVKSSILIVNGIKPEFDQLYIHWKKIISWILGSFFYTLIVTVGLIFLVIPGIYFMIRYGFYGWFIVDKDYGPIESLQVSARATRGIKWQLFFLFLIILLINIVGFLLLGVGLLITAPVSMLAVATVYKMIQDAPVVAIPDR
jgi:uncharacterized membrane protein